MLDAMEITKLVKLILKRDKLVEKFNLTHWNIKFDVGETIGETHIGECTRDPAYLDAIITLNPRYANTEYEVVKTLIHELLHLALSPLSAYCESILSGFENDESMHGRQHGELQRVATEQTIVKLTESFFNILYPTLKQEN